MKKAIVVSQRIIPVVSRRFHTTIPISDGISYGMAQSIAEDTFNENIVPYKSMMGYMMEDYIR